LSTPKQQSKLMAHQTSGGFGRATPVQYSPTPEYHHDKPEEHKEKETFDEDISLEEALSTL